MAKITLPWFNSRVLSFSVCQARDKECDPGADGVCCKGCGNLLQSNLHFNSGRYTLPLFIERADGRSAGLGPSSAKSIPIIVRDNAEASIPKNRAMAVINNY